MADGTSQIPGLNKELETLEEAIEKKRYITPTTKRHSASNVRMNITGGQCSSYNCYANCGGYYKQCSPANGCYRQCSPYSDSYFKTTPSEIQNKRKELKELISELINDIHIHNK